MNQSQPRSARLSIVIPAVADVAAMEDTLVSVLEHRPDGSEVVVALGCDYTDPWNIGSEVRLVRAPRGAGLVACTNIGVAACTGGVIHVLAAGWRATADWTTGPCRLLRETDAAAVVPVAVAADDPSRRVPTAVRTSRGGRRLEATMGRLTARDDSGNVPLPKGTAPVIETGFWRADHLDALAGFTAACGDGLADADMAVTLAAVGGRVLLDTTSLVVAGSPRRREPSFLAGLHAERLFWRSLANGPILPGLVMHAVEVFRHAVSAAPLGSVPMLAGRLIGFLQFGTAVQRARTLHDLAAAMAADREPPTVRLDAGHATLAGPHTGEQTVPLRRSA